MTEQTTWIGDDIYCQANCPTERGLRAEIDTLRGHREELKAIVQQQAETITRLELERYEAIAVIGPCVFVSSAGVAGCETHGGFLEHVPGAGWRCKTTGRIIPFGAEFGSEWPAPHAAQDGS